jgi:hypothetical protein
MAGCAQSWRSGDVLLFRRMLVIQLSGAFANEAGDLMQASTTQK